MNIIIFTYALAIMNYFEEIKLKVSAADLYKSIIMYANMGVCGVTVKRSVFCGQGGEFESPLWISRYHAVVTSIFT